MNAEIIAIGDEILIGQIVDTNSAWIAGKLNDCLLYTSPSPRDVEESRMPSSA